MIAVPDLKYESILWKSINYIAGLDEAGRGALAGPVCVGAVILPPKAPNLLKALNGVRDSKQLSPLARQQLAPQIKVKALSWGIGFASAAEIDTLGIVPATRLAAGRALEMLEIFPEFLLTDFRLELPELDVSQTALIKGDQRSLSIAAASILAKTARDELMREIDSVHPVYGFAKHKGYGTILHQNRIEQFGFSPLHRTTFKLKKSGRL